MSTNTVGAWANASTSTSYRRDDERMMDIAESSSFRSSQHRSAHTFDEETWGVPDARPILPIASFFIGDLRDGLPMLNMQAAFLISVKHFSEKQVGVLFFVFGLSQVICLTPSGYFLDYSNNKINWVIFSGLTISALTVTTALTAGQNGENMAFMIILKILQGGITAILPPGFNGITLGIVGSTGFTLQVSRNRMMNHIGTALVVAVGSLIAYYLYPDIGKLFIVSPLAALAMCYHLRRIKPTHINTDAARGLIIESPTMTEYEQMDEENEAMWDSDTEEKPTKFGAIVCSSAPNYVPPDILSEEHGATNTTAGNGCSSSTETSSSDDGQPSTGIPRPKDTFASAEHAGNKQTSDASAPSYGSGPSFNFGWGKKKDPVEPVVDEKPRRAQSPLAVLMDPTLMIFSAVVFFFHLANSSVLPLVMQSLSLNDPQAGILLSGLCIMIAQGFMAFFAKLAGDFSPIWGRKKLLLVALVALTLRCFLLTELVAAKDEVETKAGLLIVRALILSTQLLDSVGAGIFGTLHILVTNDISGGTGRFSLMLGITTGSMCLGGTVSGYIGQALAQDYGYPAAFSALGCISLVPFFMYVFFMPETLPEYAKPKPKKRKRRLHALLQRLNNQRRNFTPGNPFGIRRNPDDAYHPEGTGAGVDNNKPAGVSLVELV